MKVLFCGLGSMGQRHARNLAHLMEDRGEELTLHALRSGKGQSLGADAAVKIRELFDWSEADTDYDCVFITNPTALHYETLWAALPRSRKIFIEKPVFMDGREDVAALPKRAEHICYVAAPLRFSRIIVFLKDYLMGKKVLSVRAICSSYLPEWRPGTDWRSCYSANAAMGGGVDIDLIHEWDYLVYLFGFPQKVYSIRGRYGDVTADSVDNAVYIGDYDHMSASVYLDYFGRVSRRELEIYLPEDVLTADFIRGRIRWLKSGETLELLQDRDELQCAELNYFLALNSERDNMNTVEQAMMTLRLAKGDY